MSDWERNTITEKEDFCRRLDMEDVTNVDYKNSRSVLKYFEIKNQGELHDLFVQSNKFLLSDVFINFPNMCLEIYKLESSQFFSSP